MFFFKSLVANVPLPPTREALTSQHGVSTMLKQQSNAATEFNKLARPARDFIAIHETPTYLPCVALRAPHFIFGLSLWEEEEPHLGRNTRAAGSTSNAPRSKNSRCYQAGVDLSC